MSVIINWTIAPWRNFSQNFHYRIGFCSRLGRGKQLYRVLFSLASKSQTIFLSHQHMLGLRCSLPFLHFSFDVKHSFSLSLTHTHTHFLPLSSHTNYHAHTHFNTLWQSLGHANVALSFSFLYHLETHTHTFPSFCNTHIHSCTQTIARTL